METVDPQVLERAERAVGQLASHMKDLHMKKVKLVGRIQQDASELAELEKLITIMESG
jgi:hypothetical protein